MLDTPSDLPLGVRADSLSAGSTVAESPWLSGMPLLPRHRLTSVTKAHLVQGYTHFWGWLHPMTDGSQGTKPFPRPRPPPFRMSLKLEASSQLQNFSEGQWRVTWCFLPAFSPPWVLLIPRALRNEPDHVSSHLA